MISVLFYIAIVILNIFTFWDFPSMYFQQDEWHGLGFILSEGARYITQDQSPFQLLFSGDRFLARTINYFLFTNFGLDAKPFVVTALFFHILNSFLLYKVVCLITKQKIIGFLSVLFFLTNSISHQAYTWFGTMAGTAPSLTFVLLSLYFYFEFIFKKKGRFKYLSLIFIWASFLFKEIGLFLFALYPAVFYLYRGKDLKANFKENLSFISYGVFIVALRANEILNPVGPAVNVVTGKTNLGEIFLNVFLYPFEGLSQVIIPNLVYPFSGILTRLIYKDIEPNTTEFDVITQQTLGNFGAIVLSVIFIIIIYLISKRIKITYVKHILFSLLFIFLSFLPYIVFKKSEAFLEQRYYYGASVGAAILLALIFTSILQLKNKFLRLTTAFIIIIFIFNHVLVIREDLKSQKETAEERIKIISTVEKIIPVLPEKIIFYFNSDASGYYGIPELQVPFQSGLGQVLLTVYAEKKQIDPHFLRESSLVEMQNEGFLYNILGQGYREVDGKGFGYFYDKKKLVEAVKEYKLDVNKFVYSFYYESEMKLLNDTSADLRKEILKSL